ncbi:hypothetical protein OESDEN_17933, partial [Oesophagostomum dentatum]
LHKKLVLAITTPPPWSIPSTIRTTITTSSGTPTTSTTTESLPLTTTTASNIPVTFTSTTVPPTFTYTWTPTTNLITNSTVRSTTALPSGCIDGYRLIQANAVVSSAGPGKFGGFFTYVTSCAELCSRDYGLFQCAGYAYEPTNRGKCTIYQRYVSTVRSDSSSTASVYMKC